jgi:hypothetical protein
MARTAGLVLVYGKGTIKKFELTQSLYLNHRTHIGVDHFECLALDVVYLGVDLL